MDDLSLVGWQSFQDANATVKLLGFKNCQTMAFLHLAQRANAQPLYAKLLMVTASSPCLGSFSQPEMADSRAVTSDEVLLTATHSCTTSSYRT